jgi:hypothetical protein
MDVIFFPRNDYPNNIEVCAHRLGKKMTYTEQTDGVIYNISYSQFTSMAKERGIKVGCFINITDASITDTVKAIIKADAEHNDVWFDIYSMTEALRSKIQNRETITPEEFTASYNNYLLPYFFSIFDKHPVALSYAYGNDSFKDAVPSLFLGARNSGYNSNTDYGVGYGNPNNAPYSTSFYKSKQGSTRWYDEAKVNNNDFTGQLQIVSEKIDETMLNGGWYNNFTHWHNYWQDGNEAWASVYLDLLAAKNVNNDIYFCGYGEAIAYLVYRTLITRAVMYEPVNKQNTLCIRLECINSLSIDKDLLQIPISIKFSTIGTILEGQIIESNCNLISLTNENYIIEIPYSSYPFAEIIKK